MEDRRYNGWANYETWAVQVEICDGLCEMWEDDGIRYEDVDELATALQETVEGYLAEEARETGFGEDGLIYQWAMRSLSRVDWHDIAAACADELVRPETAEEVTE